MALAFKSKRVTGDVDFTSLAEPDDLAEKIVDELNKALPRTAIRLGYPDLLCKVQSVKKHPRPENFEDYDFPALKLRVGFASRGTTEEKRLEQNKSTRVVVLEVGGSIPLVPPRFPRA